MKDSRHRTAHFLSRSRYARILGLLILLLLIVTIPLIIIFFNFTQKQQPINQGTPTASPPTASPPTASPTEPIVKSVVVSILDNIKQNGFNSDSSINNGLGGLWINWRYGTDPLQTNFAGSGNPDKSSITPPRHDPLTDIRYLHNLWLYKSQNPSDTRYDSEIAKYTPIIKTEFANAHDERGWLYDEEFIDLYALSGDSFYKDQALNLVTSYANAIDPNVGIMYKKSTNHTQGFYRVDLVLESGLALIQAGTQFNNPSWIQQGQRIVNFVYTHAYIPQYHTFGNQMDQVLLPDGSVNPSEIFYVDKYKYYTIQGNTMRMGSISQIIISLLHTYQVTHNQDFLTKAEDLLDSLSLPTNSLGMWDTTDLGYFGAVTFHGTTPQRPGSITVSKGKKEAGRQVLMLWAFHLANRFTKNKYQNMENQMLSVALTKAFYAPGHGVLYEVNRNWTPLRFSDGTLADVVTTEAMGAELESLFSLKR